MFAGFGDFSFYQINLSGAHLVAGFGRIVDLAPADLLTDLTGADALLVAEPEVIEHMNADHADTCRLYATRLLGAPDGAWRCVGCDPEGLDLQSGRAGDVIVQTVAGSAGVKTAPCARQLPDCCGATRDGGIRPDICALRAHGLIEIKARQTHAGDWPWHGPCSALYVPNL